MANSFKNLNGSKSQEIEKINPTILSPSCSGPESECAAFLRRPLFPALHFRGAATAVLARVVDAPARRSNFSTHLLYRPAG
jgi:hypothetical protein